MPITQTEASRLSRRTGLNVDDFSWQSDGIRMLLNDPSTKACVFLLTSSSDPFAEGMCSVYEIRPKGCQTYPYVLNDHDEAILDEGCPHKEKFDAPTQEITSSLLNLEEQILHERQVE